MVSVALTLVQSVLPKDLWLARDGIQMFNIHYRDNVLTPLAGRSSKPVLIKYDRRILPRVFYRDKDGHYWPVPYRNLGAPSISLWEQREAMKRLPTEGRRLVDERLFFDTTLAQRKLRRKHETEYCRVFLGQRARRETLGKHSKGGRLDGGLKMDWTKPLARA